MGFFKEITQHRLALIVVALMCVMGLVAQHVAKSNAAFKHAYLVYAAAADEADMAAYIPTALNNPIRQEISLLLVQVLQNKITDAERLSKAERGRQLLKIAKSEIDGMTSKIEVEASAITEMEKSLNPADAFFQTGAQQKIVTLAKDRLAATKDIQSLSYRANFETEKIFQHLVESKGVLSNSYVTDLNNLVPGMQDDFDRRQNRYRDLQTDFDGIQQAYREFTAMYQTTP